MEPRQESNNNILTIAATRKHSQHICFCWRVKGQSNFVPGDFAESTRAAINTPFSERIRRDGRIPSEIYWGKEVVLIRHAGIQEPLEATPMLLAFDDQVNRDPIVKETKVEGVTFEGYMVDFGTNRNEIPELFKRHFGLQSRYVWDGQNYIREDDENLHANVNPAEDQMENQVQNNDLQNEEAKMIDQKQQEKIISLQDYIEDLKMNIEEVTELNKEKDANINDLTYEIVEDYLKPSQADPGDGVAKQKNKLGNITNQTK